MGLQGISRIGCCCGCQCKPHIIARQTVRNDLPPWDLTPYQGPGMACPGSQYRLQESNSTIYHNARVDAEGRLTGLRDTLVSNYSYYGYMRLEIGCYDENGRLVWPSWTNEGL